MHLISVIGALVTLWGACEGLRGIGRTVKLTHADRAMLINYHNELRREVHASNMQELSWDREAARAARKWGRMCKYDRPRNDRYGENIFYNKHNISEPTSEVTMDALGVWSKEKNTFDSQQSCVKTRSCDYLKMVTANVESVGCAITKCPVLRIGKSRRQHNVNLVACFYTPFIDVSQTEPYMYGAPCTYCRTGYSCRRGLCSPPVIPMPNMVIEFGDEYDKDRQSNVNHIIKESNPVSNKHDTPAMNTIENDVSQTIGDRLPGRSLGDQAELRRGRTVTRTYRRPTSGQSNVVHSNRFQELTSRVKRQATRSRSRYNRYDPYAAERRRRREEERRRQHEMRRKRLEEEQRRRQEEERRRRVQNQAYRRRDGQGQGPVEQRSRGELSDNDEYYLLQIHNNIRTSGIAKLEWSKRLEKWARYVIRCDIEYPGPAFCFTNFGKIGLDRPIYNIVYDWNAEGTALSNELETGCRTPYDRSLCNHHLVMNNRDIREMACASLDCGGQRQVTCIYQ